MRAIEFLTEYNHKGRVKGTKDKIYRDGGKPDWYDKAVKLKTNKPRMTAREIGKLVGHVSPTVLYWLAGKPDSVGNIYNDNPPFTMKDFPYGQGAPKYFDGEKPWWYEQAIKLRKQGMIWKDIADKLSTPEERIIIQSIHKWLVKGSKYNSGKLVNPDAPFTAKVYNTKKIDTTEIEELILAKIDDADIIKYIRDEKGDKIANQVRAMLPQLRQKLNPGTSVIDKKTGERQDWVVQ
jgi:hypothetical protein